MISATRATGRGPRGPVRIFIRTAGGVGTHTDFGLVISRLDPVVPLSDYLTEHLAHELLHDWLGSRLLGDSSVVWFYEGFTEYLANWHGTATGLFTRDRFADRILAFEREARTNSSLGRVAFAQPGIDWRDSDGPNEIMAYKGGALLAFVLDVELRRRGQSVSAIIRELLASDSRDYGLADLRGAMARLGLSDLYERSIARTDVPAAHPLLVEMGFVDTKQQASLTYLGIEARYEGPADATEVVPAIVTAIDSAGPAAKAGVRPGDRIIGYGDRRGDPPELGPGAPPHFQFGLNVIPSGARSIKLQILRDGTPMQIEVAPVRIGGGQRSSMRWNAERQTDFFDLPRR
jgi:predicted metalloprotease with PDZ domain